jgi:hypothetical protein
MDLLESLKHDPQKRKELMERFPQLRAAVEKRMAGGGGGGRRAAAGGAAPGVAPAAAAAAGPADPAAKPAGAELGDQLKALQKRVDELGATLQRTRAELEEARRERTAPATAALAETIVADAKRQGASAKAKLASLKKATPKK